LTLKRRLGTNNMRALLRRLVMIKQVLVAIAFIVIAEVMVMAIFEIRPAELTEVLPW
jgi:hypothetical protein